MALTLAFLCFITSVVFIFKELLDDDIEKQLHPWYVSPLFPLNMFIISFFSVAISLIYSLSFDVLIKTVILLFILFNLEFAGKCSRIPFETKIPWFNSKNSWRNKHFLIRKLGIKNKFLRDIAFSIITCFSDLEHFAQFIFYVTFVYFASGGNWLYFIVIYVASTTITQVVKKRMSLL